MLPISQPPQDPWSPLGVRGWLAPAFSRGMRGAEPRLRKQKGATLSNTFWPCLGVKSVKQNRRYEKQFSHKQRQERRKARDKETKTIAETAKVINNDQNCFNTMLPIRDGLMLCIKK